jgi:hypothetical protein
MGNEPLADIAVLKLQNNAPEDAGVATLAPNGPLQTGTQLLVYGVKGGRPTGNYVQATYIGPVDAGLIQFDGNSFATPFVAGGYSGAAVRNRGDEKVVGMAVARYDGADLVAYMLPIATLRAAIHDLVLPPAPPALASSIKLEGIGTGVRKDILTRFCQHCADKLIDEYSPVPLATSQWAVGYTDFGQRFFYLIDTSHALNALAEGEKDNFPLSFELFFDGLALDRQQGINFEVALVWDVEYDEEIFGTYQSEQRMQTYCSRIQERLKNILPTDFVKIGAGFSNLEIGYLRRLSLRGPGLVEDRVRGVGASSAVLDIVNLKQCVQPLMETILEYRRP